MSAFAYSMTMAILHSLWQAALLWLLYKAAVTSLLRRNHPLDKRNFAFLSICAQLTLFIITFILYYSDSGESGNGFIAFTASLLPGIDLQALSPWLFCLYGVMLLIRFTLSLYSWTRFRNRYLAGIIKPSVDLKLFTSLKAFQFGIQRKVTLWLSTTIHTPITFGFFRPVIVLPVALVNQLSLQQAETLILHELTHIRTNDYLLNWFLIIAENIFFFNPFILAFGKTIRLEREKNCDLSVLAFSYSPALYAETLLHTERLRQMVPAFSLAAVHHKKQLLNRIRFFSSAGFIKQPRRLKLALPLIILFMLVFIGSATLTGPHKTNAPSAFNQDLAVTVVELPATNNEFSEWNNEPVEATLTGQEREFMEKAEQVINNKMPAIERKMQELKPLLRKLEKRALELSETAFANQVIPVALKELDTLAREVWIQEEVSGQKAKAVKAYRMIFVNGQWVMVPQWIATAREVADSIGNRKDDSSVRRMRMMQ